LSDFTWCAPLPCPTEDHRQLAQTEPEQNGNAGHAEPAANWSGKQTGDGKAGDAERVKVEFTGTWDRYKRVKQITDEFGKETPQVNVRTTLVAVFPGGLLLDSLQFQTIRDVFGQLGMGKVVAEAEQVKGAPAA